MLCLSTLHSHFSLLTSLVSHFSPFVSQQVSLPLFPSHPSPSQNLPRRCRRRTCRSSQGSCGLCVVGCAVAGDEFVEAVAFLAGAGLWVVLWVCDLFLYSNGSTMGLWFVIWVCVLWWLWMCGFVGCGLFLFIAEVMWCGLLIESLG